MYLVNSISDDNRSKFENELKRYCSFSTVSQNQALSPVGMLIRTLMVDGPDAWGGISDRISIWVWGENSPFSSPLNEKLFDNPNVIPVLYASKDYLEHNRALFEEHLMKNRVWFYIDSNTNEGFDKLMTALQCR